MSFENIKTYEQVEHNEHVALICDCCGERSEIIKNRNDYAHVTIHQTVFRGSNLYIQICYDCTLKFVKSLNSQNEEIKWFLDDIHKK